MNAQAFTGALELRNRQRRRRVDLRYLRRILQTALYEAHPRGGFDLAFYFVSAAEITHLNETFLQHRGSTDVITFDYSEPAGTAFAEPKLAAGLRGKGNRAGSDAASLHGEIFVCLDVAVEQARKFRTTWQSELVRYAVHGLLHLLGYDDCDARHRRRMKAQEDALVRSLSQRFDFRQLSAAPRSRRSRARA